MLESAFLAPSLTPHVNTQKRRILTTTLFNIARPVWNPSEVFFVIAFQEAVEFTIYSESMSKDTSGSYYDFQVLYRSKVWELIRSQKLVEDIAKVTKHTEKTVVIQKFLKNWEGTVCFHGSCWLR